MVNNNSNGALEDNVLHLIDVFVDMCFDDINSIQRISQFKILGLQLGHTQTVIERVVTMGKSEYSKLLSEYNQLRA